MNIYDWYKIFNLNEFLALGLVSYPISLELEDLGEKTFVLFKGNMVSIRMDDLFIPCEFNEENPYEYEGHASYVDSNGDIWLGFLNEG